MAAWSADFGSPSVLYGLSVDDEVEAEAEVLTMVDVTRIRTKMTG